MPNNIDFKFLSDLEGGSQTKGYVPAANVSKSGVTIATGFDLGQRTESDLNDLGLAGGLIQKLKPYLGAKSNEAADLIQANPLSISEEEAESIDKAVKTAHVNSLVSKYADSDHNTAKVDFFDLPAEAQTVISSVSFQYGVNLHRATPMFWKASSSQNWQESVAILKDFGDAYPTRRNKEAAVLEKIV